ncbi:ABC transporter permease [Elioraea sp. Yellowstone]|jgi:peptide/nickel transport system permease protein|uniref:ABC transporter permease n=1 Tax=Elioraea sp. Yellowstone TaxID=2592070 RepID=UPI00114EFE24|nr:ABC transporter permease [Elioraea sp. Yellowstone]TQF79257.1 ABC transporter permease [Elioraea sp. Yellowstone]
MLRLIGQRLLQGAVTVAILSFAAYALIGLMPGDPIDLAIAGDPRLSAEDAARLRALHGLDQPLTSRYLAWASGALQGQFGFSRLFAAPAHEVLGNALLNSLALLLPTTLLSAAIGIALGVLAARRPRGALDYAVNAIAFAGISLPSFWLGILLIILFAVTLGWLPAGGPPDTPGLAAWLRHLALPGATLTVLGLASYARQTRAAMIDALGDLYIRTARAKGAPERRVLLHHALPNAAIPIVTIAGLDFATLVSGALVVETVFAWPGMGKLIYDAILGNDYNLALLALMLTAIVTLAANLLADLAQLAIDPRVRQ